jgi:hypothetical protein
VAFKVNSLTTINDSNKTRYRYGNSVLIKPYFGYEALKEKYNLTRICVCC